MMKKQRNMYQQINIEHKNRNSKPLATKAELIRMKFSQIQRKNNCIMGCQNIDLSPKKSIPKVQLSHHGGSLTSFKFDQYNLCNPQMNVRMAQENMILRQQVKQEKFKRKSLQKSLTKQNQIILKIAEGVTSQKSTSSTNKIKNYFKAYSPSYKNNSPKSTLQSTFHYKNKNTRPGTQSKQRIIFFDAENAENTENKTKFSKNCFDTSLQKQQLGQLLSDLKSSKKQELSLISSIKPKKKQQIKQIKYESIDNLQKQWQQMKQKYQNQFSKVKKLYLQKKMSNLSSQIKLLAEQVQKINQKQDNRQQIHSTKYRPYYSHKLIQQQKSLSIDQRV